jgi:6-pyruvoyltetrahydropterin/6-carboxytetrahydropterin synthase
MDFESEICYLKSNIKMRVTISRKAHFNAAHRLYRKDWTFEQNDAIFGKCNNPNYHGHNYELIVGVTGKIDPETGFVMDVKFLSEIIKEEVEDQFDHKNLNLDVPEFENLNPTAENIVVVIWNKIRKKIEPQFDLEVILYETPRNFVTYRGE